MAADRAPTGIDSSKPSAARMYDYYLGGKDNYAVDRRAAEDIYAAIPELPDIARANRAFLQRAVRFMATEIGIRQFIDIGAGLPTQGNVHEIAHETDPDAGVVYVDNDPTVLAHGQALLSGADNTAIIKADMREPEEILGHPEVQHLIDFDQPVAVLLIAVLHFVPDELDPAGIVDRFRQAMAPGSYLAIAHATREDRPPDAVAKMSEVYERSATPFVFRTHHQVLRLFDGFELVEPGLVHAPLWRGDPDGGRVPGAEWNLGGVARKR